MSDTALPTHIESGSVVATLPAAPGYTGDADRLDFVDTPLPGGIVQRDYGYTSPTEPAAPLEEAPEDGAAE